ncbi:MAG: hypothetical protein ACK5IQ_01050 [Bacteroidales bacterium]
MGTLVAHIFIFVFLIYTDMKAPANIVENEVVIDFSQDIEASEEQVEETQDDKQAQEALTNEGSARGEQHEVETTTNISEVVRQRTDNVFDEDYDEQIEQAKALVQSVSNNLAKKIPELPPQDMSVVSSDGMTEEEAKEKIFSGESNIVYYLDNRYHKTLFVPVYLAKSAQKVEVEIIVDRQGRVLKANPVIVGNPEDLTIYAYAKQAALRSTFNVSNSSPSRQRGKIVYSFVGQ